METISLPPQTPLKWFEIWRIAFLHPTASTFLRIAEDPKASIKWGVVWMAISSFIAWYINPLRYVWWGFAVNAFGLQAGSYFQIIGAILAPVVGVISLLVGSAVLHWIARFFGGAGAYRQLVYCWAVISLPYILLCWLVMYIPQLFFQSQESRHTDVWLIVEIITWLIFFGINFYLFYANVVAFGAIERIGFWKGFGVSILLAIVVTIIGRFIEVGIRRWMMFFIYRL